MAKNKRPKQEDQPGTNTLPATISIRPSEPYWPELLEIANTLGISLGDLSRMACEATVRMVKGDEIRVPEYIDRARALYADGFGPGRQERIFPGQSVAEPVYRDVRETSVQVFDTVPCGLPLPAWAEHSIGEARVPAGKYPEGAFGLIAKGDSLNKAKPVNGKVGIQDGDVLICQCIDHRPPQVGDLVVVRVDGEFTCKRLTYNGLVPESTNRKNKAITIPDDGVKAVAVVLDAAKLPVTKYAA